MDNLFDDFLEYDATMGADEIKYPNCNKNVYISPFFSVKKPDILAKFYSFLISRISTSTFF